MEQHPVPQNVTTFQFRLIGDMTIKQFGYMAGGIILGYIAYKLPLPFIITWPLAVTFGLGGFGLAFVPIEERPMDVWLLSFIKSVYSPTQYVWQRSAYAQKPPADEALLATTKKEPSSLASLGTKSQRVGASINAPSLQHTQESSVSCIPAQTKNVSRALQNIFSSPQKQQAVTRIPAPAGKTVSPLTRFSLWIDALFTPSPHKKPDISHPTQQTPFIPVPSVTGRHQTLPISAPQQPLATQSAAPTTNEQTDVPKSINPSDEAKMKSLISELSTLQKELQEKTLTEKRLLELQKLMAEVVAQKEKVEKELITLKQQAQIRSVPPPLYRPAGVISMPIQRNPTVRVITPDAAQRVGLPKLTTFPNIITGIIKDNETNLLPGVLVTVKDKEGIPLRALKTNRLGQFAASTQLPSGTYFIEVEDPRGRFSFDRIQITLSDGIMPSIEIIAKSKKEIERAKLEKQIFSSSSI